MSATAGYWPCVWTCEDGGPRRWGAVPEGRGLGIGRGEQLEVAAVHDAFATDALVRREPGELYALRHDMPVGGLRSRRMTMSLAKASWTATTSRPSCGRMSSPGAGAQPKRRDPPSSHVQGCGQ